MSVYNNCSCSQSARSKHKSRGFGEVLVCRTGFGLVRLKSYIPAPCCMSPRLSSPCPLFRTFLPGSRFSNLLFVGFHSLPCDPGSLCSNLISSVLPPPPPRYTIPVAYAAGAANGMAVPVVETNNTLTHPEGGCPLQVGEGKFPRGGSWLVLHKLFRRIR